MKLQENMVSVVLPVYNAGKYLHECLESLLNQTHTNIQIIAIDDKSRDDSYKILKNFQRQYKGITIFKNKKHYGMAVCYNRALKLAKGRFVTFMNPHDSNNLHRFKRQISFLLKNPKTVAVGTQYTRIDEQNKRLEKSTLPEEQATIYNTMIHASSLHPETLLIDRMQLPKDLLYFRNQKYPFIFSEVFLKFFQYGKVANITQSLYYHRENIKRYSRNHSKLKQMTTMMKLWVTAREHNYRPSLRSFLPQVVKGI
ncbi:MAG: glycosyltransferase family 2 protein [Patescibacteria group bacterium]